MPPRLLLLSFVEWAGARQRPQHLAQGLARRGWQVDYAVPGHLHRRRLTPASSDLPPGVRVVAPAALPGASRWRAVAALNDRWMRRRLAHVALQDGPWNAIVFNDPRFASVAAALPASLRVLDLMDDLAAQSPSASVAERRLACALTVADRVWTGTPSLARRVRERHRATRWVPCGVDAAHFAQPDPALAARLRRELPPGDGPVAGYFGVLNERVDGRLIEALLASGPWRVVLIGPATSRAPQLPADPRLRCLGPRPYEELPSWLALFDLALIPFDGSGPHRYLLPVKTLEYLAAGKPVLTTPLPDLMELWGAFVEAADGPAAWIEAGRRLLHDRSAAQARARAGQAAACGRRWDEMVEDMLRDLTATVAEASRP